MGEGNSIVTVPVLWISRYKNILSRGYADQGLLEAVFDHSLFRPPHPFTFQHYVNVGMPGSPYENFPDVSGAVVCIPCRHHASPEDVQWLVTNINRLDWSVVILCGDEEWVFPWQELPETPTRRVWVMQPRPEHAHLTGIPGGWYPHTHEHLKSVERLSRPIDWFFAGQVRDNLRRQSLVRALKRLRNGHLTQTNGYMQGMDPADYFTLMAQSKVVPSPSGPMHMDTARTFEALEAGCVPITDRITGRGEEFDYNTLLFGSNHPIVSVRDWFEFPKAMSNALRDWPRVANRHFAFWQRWKRDISLKLRDDILTVSNLWPEEGPVDDDITVLISTSPTPIHPSTDHIEHVIASIRAQLPLSNIVIACDGVHPDDESLRSAYTEYLCRLTHLCNFDWDNVLPIISETHQHQANMTRQALELVTTPLVLFVEHDTPLVGDINWLDVTGLLQNNKATTVQFHFNESIHPDHRHLIAGPEFVYGDSEFIPWSAWWQRPHLTRSDFYRNVLENHFSPTSRTMVEDRLYGIVRSDFEDNGNIAWENWRIVVYAPEGSLIRSTHLDSRSGHPKTEMVFE